MGFYFDGQLHIPIKRIQGAMSKAVERGLDAVIFTNYGNTDNFDRLVENKDKEGNPILDKADWDIKRVSSTVLEVATYNRKLYVIKGEEIKTKQGHLLAWGIQDPIDNQIDLEDCLKEVYKQGAIPVFSHLLTTSFAGCGRELFEVMYKRFEKEPLGVEQNGQIPVSSSDNREVKFLAEQYDVACFGTSDIHGAYLDEHMKVGLRLHTRLPTERVDVLNFNESLRQIMLFRPEDVVVGGDVNKKYETLLWNLDSIRKNGLPKVKELVAGYIRSKLSSQ